MPNWDERYLLEPPPAEPSRLMIEFSGLLPRNGLGLDVASGAGRHAVYLAERGLTVIAVDRSAEGLKRGGELARERSAMVEWVEADLEQFELPASRFNVICCFYYRQPSLYAKLAQALRPGGILFYETYTREQLVFPNGPRNPEHLLAPLELARAFRSLEVVFYREVWKSRGVASLVARRPDGTAKALSEEIPR